MVTRTVVLGLLTFLTFSQNTLSQITFGGTNNDQIHGITVDPAGNIYVVGTTFSSDLPVSYAYQPINSGTQVVYSTDSGATWKPLTSPFKPGSLNLQAAIDPTDARLVYIAAGATFCTSADAGKHFECTDLPFLFAATGVSSLMVDPHAPSTLYLSAGAPGGLFKSTDAGQTWNSVSLGLPATGFAYTISIDPFHANVLFAWTGNSGYISQDGAVTWTKSTLPYPQGTSNGETFFGFLFDAVTPGVVYGPGFNGAFTLQKSTDGGQTWTALTVPVSSPSFFGADPQNAGTLYALGYQSGSPTDRVLWKSVDGGMNWTPIPVPSGIIGPLVFDPHNPQTILAAFYGSPPGFTQATYRSVDGGKTWAPVSPRIFESVFAPSVSGTVFAIGPATSDAFLAKFLPDGQTLLFATYVGGAANDTGNAIALDPAGNIWIAGATYSADFPVTSGAQQSSLDAQLQGFAAKFTSDGHLIASTYLGGSAQATITGLALGPSGNPWVVGNWTGSGFPFTGATPPVGSPQMSYVVELDSAASQLLLAMPLDGFVDSSGNGIAVDASGNALITGTTTDPNFATTVHPLPVDFSPRPKAFVMKMDPSGSVLYSTTFSGTRGAPITGTGIGLSQGGSEFEQDHGVAVTVDHDGNAYIAGSTSAVDFPTTPGAYQTALADRCPFPAFTTNTGLIGVISQFYLDDNFVVKLSPDGTTALYSTLIGGQCFDHPISIAVDGSGRAAIAGETDSFDYPQFVPFAGAPAFSLFSSFVSVLNAAGSALDFSTYLYAGAFPYIAVGSNGTLLVAGSNGSAAQTSPVSGSFLNPSDPSMHGYLAVLTPPTAVPALNLTEVLNAFSLRAGPIAPGEIVALMVPGFVPSQGLDVGLSPSASLTTTLGGAQVLFDGVPAYLISVSAEKIVCIAPVEIAGAASSAVQVTGSGGVSNVLTVRIAPTAIGLLSADGSGSGQASARNADGSMNSADNPAPPGSQVTVYLTGVGITDPPEADGMLPAGTDSMPVARLPLSPTDGVVQSLPGFVPGMFSYTFTVPTSAVSVYQVASVANAYINQFLVIHVH